ncbi:MAG: ATP-dependent helicase [Anaerolineae bacterium]
MAFEPRPKQKEVLKFTKGRMGVSAVPGSGKTKTLSYLAARLIADNRITDDQEVLIVTLVNSAVDNFARQVGEFVQEMGLLPNIGYRVRTLHGLANDIVRQRPGLVGLADNFQIVDERESSDILQDAAIAWVRTHPDEGVQYFDPEMDELKQQRISQNEWPDLVVTIAGNFIKQAKDEGFEPEDIRRGLARYGRPLPLAEMCLDIYIDYQRSLSYRGGVDFQDLIRLALKALELDPAYLQRLQKQWPYILEDEAQDSSLLQEKILRALTGEKGSWVRVGDPNQAIYETFTTARPEYLRDFLTEKGVKARELPNSGRSTKSIINMANFLIDWSQERHPVAAVRTLKPLQKPLIEPTPRNDPQPNPKDDPKGLVIYPEGFPAAQEIDFVVELLRDWLPQNTDKTVAVLVPRNERGAQVVKALKAANLDVVELLRSTSTTRETAGALVLILDALSRPGNPAALALAYKVWRRDDRSEPAANARLEKVVKALRTCELVEDYLWPRLDHDWLDGREVTELTSDDEVVRDHLIAFRALVQRWQQAVLLPVDQLILTVAQDLFDTAADLAIAHSLAVTLRRDLDIQPRMRLPEFVKELSDIAQNKRRVVQLDEDGTGFDPEKHKGKVTVATLHRAKGLEWDRVYLMSVNNYDFPSAEPQDQFISEKWFVRDQLNLEAEALAQLKALTDPLPIPYQEGAASQAARIDYAAERLRLLYVGITRARRDLIITWNTGRRGEAQQATPLIALQTYQEARS